MANFVALVAWIRQPRFRPLRLCLVPAVWLLAISAGISISWCQEIGFPTNPKGVGAPAANPNPSGQPVILTARNVNVPAAVAHHPLTPALDLAYMSFERTKHIRDCSFTFVRREEINGQLIDHDFMFMKVRNEPFSVYLYCYGPVTPKGQEAIYVDGRNEGKAWAHPTGLLHKVIGTVSLLPTSSRMMDGNRYPMTDAGPLKMLKKLIEFHEEERKYGECDVKIVPGVKVDDRDCTFVQVSHPVPRQNFSFHKVNVYYDKEWSLPIRWEAYDWPRAPGSEPRLVEEYTFRDLKFNSGLSDADFDISNPAYSFQRK